MYKSKRRIAARENYLVATSAERKQAASGKAARPRVFSEYQANIRISFAEICAKHKIIYSRKENHAFPQRNPICRYFGLWEEGEFLPVL